MDQQTGQSTVYAANIEEVNFAAMTLIEGYELTVQRTTGDWVSVTLYGGPVLHHETAKFLFTDSRREELRALLIVTLMADKREGISERIATRAIEMLDDLRRVISRDVLTLKWRGVYAEVIDPITGQAAKI